VVTNVSEEHAAFYKIFVDNQRGNKRRFSGEISTEYVKRVSELSSINSSKNFTPRYG
jgi:hypothetical protein